MKKFLFSVFLAVIFLIPIHTFADYRWAIGPRYGLDAGITYKQFFTNRHTAFEFMLSHRFRDYGGYKALFLYQYHKENEWRAFYIPGLSWVLGAGFHLSYYAPNRYPLRGTGEAEHYKEAVFPIGVDTYAGIFYQMKEWPFEFGFDIRPFYEFFKPGPYYMDAGVTFRIYVD